MCVTGRNLAHQRRSYWQRARLAARLVRGETILTPLTIKQAAAICGAAYHTVAVELAALKAEDAALPSSETLADHFSRATPAERLEAAREIGVGAIWDSMVNPLLEPEEQIS
jgi:hypothetical protein